MRMPPKELKALLVDFDGTLIDSLPALWNCYQTFMYRRGKIATRNEFIQLAGPSLKEIIIYLKVKYELTPAFEELYKEYRELILECYSRDAIMFPNALEVLQRLKMRGIKLALVTSATSAFIEPFNQRANFDKLFDAIITHVEGEETKPSPVIYKRALESLNIAPEEVIAVEDSKNGVLSAHAAQIYVVQFRGGSTDVSIDSKLENVSFAVKNWLALEKICMKILIR